MNKKSYRYFTDNALILNRFTAESLDISNLEIKKIGPNAFDTNSWLKEIILPKYTKDIGYRAFNNCENLENVVFGDSVSSIGNYAFYNCGNLKNITLPNSLEKIGESAFQYCRNLANINFNGTISEWNAISFGNFWNLETAATYVQCTNGQVQLQ